MKTVILAVMIACTLFIASCEKSKPATAQAGSIHSLLMGVWESGRVETSDVGDQFGATGMYHKVRLGFGSAKGETACLHGTVKSWGAYPDTPAGRAAQLATSSYNDPAILIREIRVDGDTAHLASLSSAVWTLTVSRDDPDRAVLTLPGEATPVTLRRVTKRGEPATEPDTSFVGYNALNP